MSTSETVEFSAKVPKELYDRFRSLLPIYGASQWVINTSLAAFVTELEQDPSLVEKVKGSVAAMLQLNRTLKETSV